MKKLFAFILCAFVFFVPVIPMAAPEPAGDQAMTDQMLWEHLQRRSQAWYEQYVQANGGAVDPGDWKLPIENAFIKIANASGHTPFRIQYSVIKPDSFNAGAFAGGQFVIQVGALRALDLQASAAMQADGPMGGILGIQYYRERAIAPVLAHELAHFYNRHTFQTIKKLWSLEGKKEDRMTLDMMQHSRENEFDADRTGCLLMEKAGYNSSGMIALLNLLNQLTQEYKKKGYQEISYFSSHPSAHLRIAAIDGKGGEAHRWAAEMDQLFEDIQFGKNLTAAIAKLDEALKQYPDNIHFAKARAVALHKLWLTTVPIKLQRLKPVVAMPGFRDDMAFPAMRRGGRGIPGNLEYYNRAAGAYRALIDRALDPSFESNYAVLLCYSPAEADIANAQSIALSAAQRQSTIGTLSNLVMVFYMTGKTPEALQLGKALVAEIDKGYAGILSRTELDQQTQQQIAALQSHIKQCQIIDKDYVLADFTPVLNLALILRFADDAAGAQSLANAYFTKCESTSSWAAYLSATTGSALPAPPKDGFSLTVREIKVGDSLAKVLKTWNKPAEIITNNGCEYWYYTDIDSAIMMENGHVAQIVLGSARSPRVSQQIAVGVPRETIEQKLGSVRGQSGVFFIYGAGNDVAVEYVLGIATRIILIR